MTGGLGAGAPTGRAAGGPLTKRYESSRPLRTSLRVAVPTLGALLPYLYAELWPASVPYWGTVAVGIVVVLLLVATPVISFLVDREDELWARRREKERAALGAEIEGLRAELEQAIRESHRIQLEHQHAERWWSRRVEYWATLVRVFSDFTLNESGGLIELALQGRSDLNTARSTLANYDSVWSRTQRILDLLYQFMKKQEHVERRREFQVLFFAADQGQKELRLRFALNREAQFPAWARGDGSHPELAKSGQSLASLAWRRREAVIVSDVVDALKGDTAGFVLLENRHEPRAKSVAVHPVIDRRLAGAVPSASDEHCYGVLWVECSESNYFRQENEHLIKWGMEAFAARLTYAMRRHACFEALGASTGGGHGQP